MARLAIIDYGMGNLHSVKQALRAVGCNPSVTSDPEEVARADALILPGVGNYGQCMTNLKGLNLKDVIVQKIDSGAPYLGICLGYQILFEGSAEAPDVAGLGILPGRVIKFPESGLKIPHMGWNTLSFKQYCPLFEEVEPDPYFYFVHSYYVEPKDDSLVATITEYGVSFASSIQLDNIFACQFHPEKSQKLGLKVLKNFLTWANRKQGGNPVKRDSPPLPLSQIF